MTFYDNAPYGVLFVKKIIFIFVVSFREEWSI